MCFIIGSQHPGHWRSQPKDVSNPVYKQVLPNTPFRHDRRTCAALKHQHRPVRRQLDVGRAPYVLYVVKYRGLASLKRAGAGASQCTTMHMPHFLCLFLTINATLPRGPSGTAGLNNLSTVNVHISPLASVTISATRG